MSHESVRCKSVYRYGGTSQAVRAGNFLVTTGQVALDLDGEVIGVGDMKRQLEIIFEGAAAILEEAGGTLRDVIKLTVYTTDIALFGQQIGEPYSKYFGRPYPAMTTVEIAALSEPEFLVEIDVHAYLG